MEGETNTKDEIKTNYRDFKDIDLKITSNDILLPGPHLAKNPVPEKIASMVEFDIMQSSLLADPTAVTID